MRSRIRGKISIDDLKKKMDSGEDIQIVDVRGRECCYDLGHIPGAVSIPLNEFEERAPRELDRERPVIVYCGSVSCTLSPRAAHLLSDNMGFADVSDYAGGIKEWQDTGSEVEK
ncbi:MAG TPA: rhodanese-like domain-containing protein [Euryarchaeota archaeon]|nr:rhodanese-like domain-containing protein [Euryarchaeota archaeon]